MKSLTCGSLFSGIAGIELGLSRAGIQPLWQVELDEKFCHKNLQVNFPNIKRLGDIKTVGAHNLKHVDIICGGFPCQDVSSAWAGPGLQGTRSGLWHEYARVVRELKPKWVVIENVANLRKRGLDIVLSDLSAIGYTHTSALIPACAVGAPHERKRLWILAWREWEPVKYAAELPKCECCEEPFCEDCQEHFAECACAGPHSEEGWSWVGEAPWGTVAYPDMPRCFEQRWASTIQKKLSTTECFNWWATEPSMDRVVDGLPGRVDKLNALGNAVVPFIPEMLGHLITSYHDSL